MKLPNHISALLHSLNSSGFEAFVVGGCVRDLILNREPADWDICSSAQPNEVQALFKDIYAVIPTGIEHGTVTVVLPFGNVEITTFRKDGDYHDHRKPDSVTFTSAIEEDLRRRDFTINAMAYSENRGLIDLFNGREHLKQRLLSCVGNPKIRFNEDALRILRALRFASLYQLKIEENTAASIHSCKDGLKDISAERIWSELKKMLPAPDLGKILEYFPDILSVVFPEYGGLSFSSIASSPNTFKTYTNIFAKLTDKPLLRLAGIFYWFIYNNPRIQKDIYLQFCRNSMKRLKTDNASLHKTIHIAESLLFPIPETLTDARKMVKIYGIDGLEDFLDFKKAEELLYLTEPSSKWLKADDFFCNIKEKNLCCSIENLAINGNDLKNNGMLSGTEIGNTLNIALDKVITDQIPNEKKALINFLFS